MGIKSLAQLSRKDEDTWMNPLWITDIMNYRCMQKISMAEGECTWGEKGSVFVYAVSSLTSHPSWILIPHFSYWLLLICSDSRVSPLCDSVFLNPLKIYMAEGGWGKGIDIDQLFVYDVSWFAWPNISEFTWGMIHKMHNDDRIRKLIARWLFLRQFTFLTCFLCDKLNKRVNFDQIRVFHMFLFRCFSEKRIKFFLFVFWNKNLMIVVKAGGCGEHGSLMGQEAIIMIRSTANIIAFALMHACESISLFLVRVSNNATCTS